MFVEGCQMINFYYWFFILILALKYHKESLCKLLIQNMSGIVAEYKIKCLMTCHTHNFNYQ